MARGRTTLRVTSYAEAGPFRGPMRIEELQSVLLNIHCPPDAIVDVKVSDSQMDGTWWRVKVHWTLDT